MLWVVFQVALYCEESVFADIYLEYEIHLGPPYNYCVIVNYFATVFHTLV